MNRVEQYTSGEERQSTDALENDIKTTRERMDETIDTLSHKLNPERYIHDAGDWVKNRIDAVDTDSIKSSAVKVGRKTGDVVRDHPIPLALGALALASWFVRKPTYDSKVRDPYIPGHPNAEGATGVIHPTVNPDVKQLPENSETNGSNGKLHAVSDAVSSAAHSVTDGISSATEYSARRISRGKDQYPAGMAIGAMAAGFLTAFALPRTRTEDKMCGESADELKDKLADQGRQLVADTKQNIREKSDELVEEVKNLADKKVEETKVVVDGKIEEAKDAIEDQIDEKVDPA